ncbi:MULTISPECIES: type II toxin-antitoxin system RelB/DinJ family antitoxin [unclassified Pannonibacter]|uniref:type II toxin-antitoxin system RelB/DinJ family antitoxin n=1 Tax=unclassified Pannonibacter TaxID=2627228 RepID=UPI001648B15B|nr:MULTISPECIES: type II toxin-antitoxin system RelB/DinJ family antitoxin [unclassified Pannonibacter]
MSATQMIHVRVDPELKAGAEQALENVGLSLSEAIRVFLHRVVRDNGMPVGLGSDPDTYERWIEERIEMALADRRPSVSGSDADLQIETVLALKK